MDEDGIPTAFSDPHLTPETRPRSSVRPPSTPNVKGTVVLPLIGLIGGGFGGLLGIGGGSAIAPLLLILGRMHPAQVSGTTLATVLVISIVGSGAYASLGYVDLQMAWPIAAGTVLGSVVGARMARHLSVPLMTGMFLALLPYFAFKELFPSLASPVFASNLEILVVLGLITGTLSGLLGISGASLVVPSLVGFFLLDHHDAQGIAIGVAIADSTAGVAIHARERNISYATLPYLAIPALFAALGGALLSNFLSGDVLKNIFGVFMVAIWAIMLLRLVTQMARRRKASSEVAATVSRNGVHADHHDARLWTGKERS